MRNIETHIVHKETENSYNGWEIPVFVLKEKKGKRGGRSRLTWTAIERYITGERSINLTKNFLSNVETVH